MIVSVSVTFEIYIGIHCNKEYKEELLPCHF